MASVAPVKVAVVGAGYIAQFAHLPSLLRLRPRAEVVAVCDTDLAKARHVARRFAIPRAYANLAEMLRDETPDLVDICVPPHLHQEALLTAVDQGVSCLVEKPLTVTVAEADVAIARARERQANLYVLHTFSALPGVRKAQAMLRSGAIGRVIGADIRYLTPLEDRHLDPGHWCHDLPGDYFSEAAPHLAMLLVELLGAPQDVKAVAAKRSRHPHVRLDELRIVAEMEGGLGAISCSFNCPSRMLAIDIFGTDGSLFIDGNSQAVVRYGSIDSSSNAWGRGLAASRDIVTRATALASTTAKVLLRQYPLETVGHRHLMERAVLAARDEAPYPIDIGDAREAVRLLELAFADVRAAEVHGAA